MTVIHEVPAAEAGLPLFRHPGWEGALLWLRHGITARDADMTLFGASPAGLIMQRWLQLRDAFGCAALLHARQVHAARVLDHRASCRGIVVADDADGHVSARAGVLLSVSVADCVPIFIAAPDARAVALLHGGWRGVAAGILERGVDLLTRAYHADAARLHVHLGPAICGACFEVGPEVPPALGLPPADGRSFLDLRALLAHRALALGVSPANLSLSAHCTRCAGSPFYSHRGGCRERQLAVIAIRSDAG